LSLKNFFFVEVRRSPVETHQSLYYTNRNKMGKSRLGGIVRSLSLLLRGRKRAEAKNETHEVVTQTPVAAETTTAVVVHPPVASQQRGDEKIIEASALQFPFLELPLILGKVTKSRRRRHWSDSESDSFDERFHQPPCLFNRDNIDVDVRPEPTPKEKLVSTMENISDLVKHNWLSKQVASKGLVVVHGEEDLSQSWSLQLNGKDLFSMAVYPDEASSLQIQLKVFDKEVAEAMLPNVDRFDPHYFATDHFLALTTCLVLQAPLEMFKPTLNPALIVDKTDVTVALSARTKLDHGDYGLQWSEDDEDGGVLRPSKSKAHASPFLAELEFSGIVGMNEHFGATAVVLMSDNGTVDRIVAAGPWLRLHSVLEKYGMSALAKHREILCGESSALVIGKDDEVSVRGYGGGWTFIDIGRHTIGVSADHEYWLICTGKVAVVCKGVELIARFEMRPASCSSRRLRDYHRAGRRGWTAVLTHACQAYASDIGNVIDTTDEPPVGASGDGGDQESSKLGDFLRAKYMTPFVRAWIGCSRSFGIGRTVHRRSLVRDRSFASTGCQVTCESVTDDGADGLVLLFAKSCAENLAGIVSILADDCLQAYRLLPPQRLVLGKLPCPTVFKVVDEPIGYLFDSPSAASRTTPRVYALWAFDDRVVYMCLHVETSNAFFVIVRVDRDTKVVKSVRWTNWRGRTADFTKGCVSPRSVQFGALRLHGVSIDGPCGSRIFSSEESTEANPIGVDRFSLVLCPADANVVTEVDHPTLPGEKVRVPTMVKETLSFTNLLTKSGRDAKDVTLHRTVEFVLNGGALAWKGGARVTSASTGVDGEKASDKIAPNTRHSKKSIIKLSETGYLVYKVCATRKNQACLVTLYVPPTSAVATAGESKYRFSDVLVVAMDLIPCLEINGGKPWSDFKPSHPDLLTFIADAASGEGKVSRKAIRAAKKRGLTIKRTSCCAACGCDRPEAMDEKEPWMTYEPCRHSVCFKCYVDSVAYMAKNAHPKCLVCKADVTACHSTKADDVLDIWKWSLDDVEKFVQGGPTEALPPVYRRTGIVYKLGARMHAADFAMDLNAVCMGGFHACLTPKPAIEGFGEFEGRVPWFAPRVETEADRVVPSDVDPDLVDSEEGDEVVCGERRCSPKQHEASFEKTPLVLPAVASSSRVYFGSESGNVGADDGDRSLTGDVTVTHSKIPAAAFDGSAGAYLKSVSFLQDATIGADAASSSTVMSQDALSDWLNQAVPPVPSGTASPSGPNFDKPWEEDDAEEGWAYFPDVPARSAKSPVGKTVPRSSTTDEATPSSK
jgi:hypothetical protein